MNWQAAKGRQQKRRMASCKGQLKKRLASCKGRQQKKPMASCRGLAAEKRLASCIGGQQKKPMASCKGLAAEKKIGSCKGLKSGVRRTAARHRLRKACDGAHSTSSLVSTVRGEETQHAKVDPMKAGKKAHVRLSGGFEVEVANKVTQIRRKVSWKALGSVQEGFSNRQVDQNVDQVRQ